MFGTYPSLMRPLKVTLSVIARRFCTNNYLPSTYLYRRIYKIDRLCGQEVVCGAKNAIFVQVLSLD